MGEIKQHGGRRKGAGPPRKMVAPVRVTVTIEQSDLNRLKEKYGRGWQDKLREMIRKL